MKPTADQRDATTGARMLAAIFGLGIIGTLVYWPVFFTSGGVQASADPCYFVFERAFPAADAWMALASLLAAVNLWHHRPPAVLFSVAAGSALIFLGLMDVLYNLENGMYALRSAEMAAEIGINVFCLTLGPTAIGYAWRHRRRFDPL